MIDFLKTLLAQHFTAILITSSCLFAIVLTLGVLLFLQLQKTPDATAKALFLEISFVKNLRRVLSRSPDSPPDRRHDADPDIRKRQSLSDLTITPAAGVKASDVAPPEKQP